MFFFAIAIICSDRGAKRFDSMDLTCAYFLVASVATFLVAISFETSEWVYPFHAIRNNILNIFGVGFCECIGFTLSTLGQRHTEPAQAALLFSLEAVMAAIAGFLMLNETLTLIECIGGVTMLGAAVYSALQGAVVDGAGDQSGYISDGMKSKGSSEKLLQISPLSSAGSGSSKIHLNGGRYQNDEL